MAKAVGMGGVFLKASDPKKLSAWYAEHLGIPTQDGSTLAFDGPESLGMTVFAHFPESTQYFGGGEQKVMINFRVDDLDALLGQLAAAGVRIDPKRDDYPYGKFAWIWDPEGNRIELWQPAAE
ncbi:MAG TPA: VOC family protein [Terracidiphilus sp.]|jgi:predicted enzyme related to lactoylglutathione lyase